jgi:hypothetical protein
MKENEPENVHQKIPMWVFVPLAAVVLAVVVFTYMGMNR